MNSFYKNVAIYLRKSRAEENENTQEVLARHKAILTNFAVAKKINVLRVYEEVVSGDSLFARPQMIDLLHEIEDGKYTGVLCIDIDRLGRGNMQEQGLILNTLKDAGAAIITPDKTYDLNDELDETQTEFKTFFARQELKAIKKRLSRGVRQTLEKGGYVSNPPFGYIRAHKDKIPTLEFNPQEAEIVRLIFRLYLESEGCQAISHRLNLMGVKPHRGEEFSRKSVRYILTNPIYTGKIVWGKTKVHRPKKMGEKFYKIDQTIEQWITTDGLHPAIIDQETFDKVGELVSGRMKPPTRVAGIIENPFAGILVCRQCGLAMSRRPFNGRKYQSDLLICPRKGCVKAARLDVVEEDFIFKLSEMAAKLEIEVQNSNNEISLKNEKLQIEKMKSERIKLIDQRNRVYELLEQGTYTVSIFNERESAITEKINLITEEIQKLELGNSASLEKAKAIIPKINNVLQDYWNCNPERKNALLKSVIKKAYYYKDKSAGPRDIFLDIELKL